MATLIDKSFFVLDLNIPNTHHAAESERVIAYIENLEPVILRDSLGLELYKKFKDDGFGKNEDSEERFKKLLDGDSFIDNNKSN